MRQVIGVNHMPFVRYLANTSRPLACLLGFTVAPFTAMDLLVRDESPLPTVAPKLPPDLTHLWLCAFGAEAPACGGHQKVRHGVRE